MKKPKIDNRFKKANQKLSVSFWLLQHQLTVAVGSDGTDDDDVDDGEDKGTFFCFSLYLIVLVLSFVLRMHISNVESFGTYFKRVSLKK